MPVRESAGLAISISGCSARNAWSRGTWSSLGVGTMSITAQYLVTAVIGVKGTNVTSWPESSRGSAGDGAARARAVNGR